MFRFWISRKEPRKLLTDTELESSKKNDDYIFRTRILNCLSWATVFVIIFLILFAGYLVYTDSGFRGEIANIIKSEFKSVFYAVLAIFGIRVLDKKE